MINSSSSSSFAIKTMAVIGAGQMGGGIAQTAAMIAKLPVILFDSSQGQLDKQKDLIESLLRKDVNKAKLTEEDKMETLSRIKMTTSLDDLSEADFIIEAICEDGERKEGLFRRLDTVLRRENAIVASNTSSISITKLASTLSRPDRFVGMHFMNPVPIMRLVELIAGRQTSQETLKATKDLAESMGKTVTLAQDIPGFIANRILMPYINEAIFTLYEGIGTREDIDKTMILGTNVPMGPLKLADFIGLDTCLAIIKVLHEQFGDSKYRPCPLLSQYVNAGWLGKKTGRGFYTY